MALVCSLYPDRGIWFLIAPVSNSFLLLMICFYVLLIHSCDQTAFSVNLNMSPKTPLAVTWAPAPAPWITRGLSP